MFVEKFKQFGTQFFLKISNILQKTCTSRLYYFNFNNLCNTYLNANWRDHLFPFVDGPSEYFFLLNSNQQKMTGTDQTADIQIF